MFEPRQKMSRLLRGRRLGSKPFAAHFVDRLSATGMTSRRTLLKISYLLAALKPQILDLQLTQRFRHNLHIEERLATRPCRPKVVNSTLRTVKKHLACHQNLAHRLKIQNCHFVSFHQIRPCNPLSGIGHLSRPPIHFQGLVQTRRRQ